MAASKITVLARTFSSSAAQSQLVKTPIPVFGMGGRYVSALYSAAVKSKEVDKIEPDFLKFYEAMNQDKKFKQIIKDPTIKKSQKAAALQQISSKLSLCKSVTNTLVLLAENGRLQDINTVVYNLKNVMAVHRGEITCEVTSAKPLTPEQKKEIETVLKKFAKGSGQVLINTKVDPAIIGGLIISIGDKYVDMSIASKLKKYTDIIKSVV